MNVKIDEPDRNDEGRKRAVEEAANGSAHLASDPHSSLDDLRKARHEKEAWDKQIEEDAKAGKLDDMIREARRDHRRGSTKPLP